MKERCFLSIIVPVYNSASCLPACLNNILSADIADIEIILVDDGSTDSSPKLCREYAGNYSFIKYISQANSGPSVARNTGLAQAKGKYVAFFDSDDHIDSSVFASVVSRLDSYEPDMWISDFERVADNGCVLDRVYQIRPGEPVTGRDYLPEFLSAKDCVWNVWRYIFRRDFIEKNHLRFREGYSIAEDLEFSVRALGLCERPVFCHDPYYHYRVNYGDTLTRRFSAERLRQFSEMLLSAADSLAQDDMGRLIRAKLAREYILNISVLCQVPSGERKAALAELTRARRLMDGTTGVYVYAAGFVKAVGIPLSATILFLLKKIRQLKRGIKVKRYKEEK